MKISAKDRLSQTLIQMGFTVHLSSEIAPTMLGLALDTTFDESQVWCLKNKVGCEFRIECRTYLRNDNVLVSLFMGKRYNVIDVLSGRATLEALLITLIEAWL